MNREEAIATLKANYPDACYEPLRDAVDAAISALEQPEIIRCKDCKHRKFVDFGMGDCLHPSGCRGIAFDNHFCALGERRDTGTA